MMNRRIIKKILRNKHKEFCASITDETVRKLVEKNSIITGGSIVSLLLKEKGKDFDYYFTNFETVEAVADYYVKEFKRLNPGHIILPEVRVEGERVRIRTQSAGITGEASDGNYQYFENLPNEEAMDYVEQMRESLDDVTVKEDPKEDVRFQPDEGA